MKLIKMMPAIVLAMALVFQGCKPKDEDIKASVEKELKENPATAGVTVMVNDGIATLSGEVADEAAKAAAAKEADDVKGVKSVVNNTTVAMPVVEAPVTVTADEPLTNAVRDATKDYPTVTATVSNGVITLNGDIEKDKLPKLMMALNALQPKSIDNKLTVK